MQSAVSLGAKVGQIRPAHLAFSEYKDSGVWAEFYLEVPKKSSPFLLRNVRT